MIGHCGGLRESQKIGDYVLAHAYLRDDHILDDVLPLIFPSQVSQRYKGHCTMQRNKSVICQVN